MLTFLSGIHSRSEGLIDDTRTISESATTQAKLKKSYENDTKKLVHLELKANLDLISDGMLRWHDPLRLFLQYLDGVIPGPYYRWFETNTFFRKPVVESELSLKRKSVFDMFYLDLLPKEQQKLIILPGPYTLSILSDNFYYRKLEELIFAYSDVLVHVIRDISSSENINLMLLEPSLVYETTRPRNELFPLISEAIEKITLRVPFSVIHTFFGDVTPVLDLLTNLRRSWIGIDLTETSIAVLTDLKECKIALGIIDSSSPIVESPSLLRSYIRIIRKLELDSVALCPSTDLRYLPRQISDEKIFALKLLRKAIEAE